MTSPMTFSGAETDSKPIIIIIIAVRILWTRLRLARPPCLALQRSRDVISSPTPQHGQASCGTIESVGVAAGAKPYTPGPSHSFPGVGHLGGCAFPLWSPLQG